MIKTGQYSDPPIVESYFFRQDGERFERIQKKLQSGGWHRLDINCRTCDVHEWFCVPDEDGYFVGIHVLSDGLLAIRD